MNNWGPATIERDLERRYAKQIEEGTLAVPSMRTIERWREEYMTPNQLLPPRLIEKAMKDLPLLIDVYRELALAVGLLSDRLVQGHKLEEEMSKAGMGVVVIPGVDKAAETLLKYLEQLWQVGQAAGVYPEGPMPAPTVAVQQMFATGGMRIEQLTDEQWKQIIELDYRARTGREPPALGEGTVPEAAEALEPRDAAEDGA